MTTTERVVRFVRTATPPERVLKSAADQLQCFRAARDRGARGPVPTAIVGLVGPARNPLWTAWISGSAAATADPELAWVAVCAAADALGSDEQQTATATAIGYEVADRVAEALGPTHTTAGWSVRATAGVIGAGAAAGRLMGLDAGQLRDALGLCATQAAGLAGATGTDADALQLGKAAGNAVEAALLGQCGVTSAAQPLEGRRGMFALMSTAADPAAVNERLGTSWLS